MFVALSLSNCARFYRILSDIIVENIIMLITLKNKTGRIISLVFMIFTDVFSVFCIILSGAVEVLSSGL